MAADCRSYPARRLDTVSAGGDDFEVEIEIANRMTSQGRGSD